MIFLFIFPIIQKTKNQYLLKYKREKYENYTKKLQIKNVPILYYFYKMMIIGDYRDSKRRF